MRIGSGFDAHKFGKAFQDLETKQPAAIKIAGVSVPYHREVLAHSDGDVVIHSLCDALLGALALGDIGKHFPDTDAAFKNIDSRSLLRDTYALITSKQFELANVDITLMAERPKVRDYVDEMRGNLAEDLMVPVDLISIKATTTEKMGFVGRQEGLAAQATVLLTPLVPST